MARRYYWAGTFCAGRDVVEVACGTGQGLAYLRERCRSLRAGDLSPALIRVARGLHLGDDIAIQELDAAALPFPDASADVVLLFEALYYLPHPEAFIGECRRILRPGGRILLAMANPDLYDFTRSPHSFRYFGAADLAPWLGSQGFQARLFGDTPLAQAGLRQALLRPLKGLASRLGLIPDTMRAKQVLKRLFFGSLVPMPARITAATASPAVPAPLPGDRPDRAHKVIFCEARLPDPGME